MADFSTSEDWTPGEQVTDVKLDNVIGSLVAQPSLISGRTDIPSPTGAEQFLAFEPSSGLLKRMTASNIPGAATQPNPTFVLLTDAVGTVHQTCVANKVYQNARWPLNVAGATRALSIDSVTDGMFGCLLISQDATGGRAVTLSGTNIALGIGTITSLDLAANPNEVTLACWTYINSVFYWTFAKMQVSSPFCRASRAAQSLTTGVAAAVGLDTEAFDNDLMHDVATNNSRITASRPGLYMAVGNLNFVSNATGDRYGDLRVNNVIMSAQRHPANATTNEINLSAAYPLNKGDYWEVIASQTSGGALNVAANLTVSRIGAL